jgi:large subunit ribosomal protein L15
MSDLSKLGRPEGAHRSRKRLGRGPGSGLGKTSGKGHKGHKARTGGQTHTWFEGGQMPLQRRLPKRGFKNPFRNVYEIVNVGVLSRLEEDEVTPEVMQTHHLVDLGKGNPVKVLGSGEVGRKMTVKAHAFSAGAKSKIEAAGGTVEQLEG